MTGLVEKWEGVDPFDIARHDIHERDRWTIDCNNSTGSATLQVPFCRYTSGQHEWTNQVYGVKDSGGRANNILQVFPSSMRHAFFRSVLATCKKDSTVRPESNNHNRPGLTRMLAVLNVLEYCSVRMRNTRRTGR
jgi:hypothetical protein